MTFPKLVRADTLDLQDTQHPSARDHTRQPSHGQSGASPSIRSRDNVHSPELVIRHHRHSGLTATVEQTENAHSQTHLNANADQWGSGRSSHEGSELLEEDTEFMIDTTQHDNHLDQLALHGGGPSDDAEMMEGDDREDREDDDDDDDDDDLTDKISSSPSISDEDIDFEFVYALHTFVATVEGQANATKGDTMVLLDDSNSYWWLVRVVKDNSIGYLPAEHIETPTERLARLNKHRNIDLAQSMLGDLQEKTKNPLKKAMRRRNAKVVQFASPTYFEPSENGWSDEEDDQQDEDTVNGDEDKPVQSTEQDDDIEPVKAEAPLKTGARNEPLLDPAAPAGVTAATSAAASAIMLGEDSATAEEREMRMSKNGTIRNTDSFFKDSTAEPKKISLTPNILREELSPFDSPRTSESKDMPAPLATSSSNGPAVSALPPASTPTASSSSAANSTSTTPTSTADIFDQFSADRPLSQQSEKDTKKDSKNKKDKKPGMLSGLFKRNKDKKLKVDEAAGGTVSKRESGAFSSPSDSPVISGRTSPLVEKSLLENPPTPISPTSPTSKRSPQGGKLSKAPPPGFVPRSTSSAETSRPSTAQMAGLSSVPQASQVSAQQSSQPSAQQDTLARPAAVKSGQQPALQPAPLFGALPTADGHNTHGEYSQQPTNNHGVDQFVPGRPAPSPQSLTQTSQLQTYPSSQFQTLSQPQSMSTGQQQPRGPFVESQEREQYGQSLEQRTPQFDRRVESEARLQQQRVTTPDQTKTDRSASPVSPITPPEMLRRQAPEQSHIYHNPARNTVSGSSFYNATNDSTSSDGNLDAAGNSPRHAHAHAHTHGHMEDGGEQAWDGAALSRYLDTDMSRDIHDLLVIVKDSSNVVPVPRSHPIMVHAGFDQHQKQLQDMSDRLDDMLTGYLARKKASKASLNPSKPSS